MKCGIVTILGPTNAGKSTLINRLIDSKISIVSKRPQTTYHGIRGIRTTSSCQMVFTDTPGYQGHPGLIPRLLNEVADRHSAHSDVQLWVFDASNPTWEKGYAILKSKIQSHTTQSYLVAVLNKVDMIKKEKLLPWIKRLHDDGVFRDIVPLSAKTGSGAEGLLKLIEEKLPEGEKLYPEDAVTDRSSQFLTVERVREQIYAIMKQELPYSVRAEVEDWQPGQKGPIISVTLFVDSDSKKGMFIGKRGAVLKEIGTRARKEVEEILGESVCLKLYVKVDDQWKSQGEKVKRYLELERS